MRDDRPTPEQIMEELADRAIAQIEAHQHHIEWVLADKPTPFPHTVTLP